MDHMDRSPNCRQYISHTFPLQDGGNNFIDDFYAFDEERPPRLLPLSRKDKIGYVLIVMALTLGASGGIGGGGIVVPVYLLVLGLTPRVAIPIGSVTVLGGAFASTLLNWVRRHPLADRPLIDWDLVLVMEPLTLIGTIIGTICHRIFSEKLLVVLLVLLLSITAHSTLKKGMRIYRAEVRYMRHLKEAQLEGMPLSPPRKVIFGVDSADAAESPPQLRPDHTLDLIEKERILIVNPDFVTLRSDLIEQEKVTPRSKILAVMIMFTILIVLNYLVGNDDYKSPFYIQCGSAAFYMIHLVMIAFLVASAWMAHTYLVARHEIKDMMRVGYADGDIKWTSKSAFAYPFLFTIAGLFAGMFGIGGGVIIVPLLLTLGVHPNVASATSSAMVAFTSFASTSTFAAFGLILHDYAIFGFCVAFVSSLVGQKLMLQLRKATSASGRSFERNSYIAFVIGGVVLVSAILMTVQYVFSIVKEPDQDYGGICDGLHF